MSATRNIERIFRGPAPHMVGDGFRVSTYFPSDSLPDQKRMSPFFLLDYNYPLQVPPTLAPLGVGAHPHKGFETVTVAIDGAVAHHDSTGHSGVIYPGDVQWMTAGAGVLHKEYLEEQFIQRGGTLHMLQLWVNLPKQYKSTSPKYQAITREQMGKVKLPNDGGELFVIAGEYDGVKGPAFTFTPINMYDVRLSAEGHVDLSLPAPHNTGILVAQGQIAVNQNDSVVAGDFLLFKNENGLIHLEARENAIVVVLSGQPIDEPIAAHGPFVMNTRHELVEAFQEFQSGKFGFLD